MLFAGGGLFLVFLVLWLYTLIEVLTSDEGAVRNLPKVAWFFVVLFTMEIGVVLWFVAGRPQGAVNLPYKGDRGTVHTSSNPDDDADFQAQLRRRVDEQRRKGQSESS